MSITGEISGVVFSQSFISSVVFSRFMQGIEQQFLALQKGFHELIPQNSLKPFDERELELVSVPPLASVPV